MLIKEIEELIIELGSFYMKRISIDSSELYSELFLQNLFFSFSKYILVCRIEITKKTK